MVQTEQAAQQSSPGGHWERHQSVDTLFSSSLHMFTFFISVLLRVSPNPTLTLLESLLPQGQKQVWLSVKDA